MSYASKDDFDHEFRAELLNLRLDRISYPEQTSASTGMGLLSELLDDAAEFSPGRAEFATGFSPSPALVQK